MLFETSELNQVVLVAHYVLDPVDMDEVYLAEGLAAEIPLQADLVLAVQISLHVVKLPWNELIR